MEVWNSIRNIREQLNNLNNKKEIYRIEREKERKNTKRENK